MGSKLIKNMKESKVGVHKMSVKEFFLSLTLGTVTNFLIGDLTTEIKALGVFFTVNLMLGIIKGIQEHQLSSKKFIQGIFKGICILFMVIVAHQLDLVYPSGLGGVVNFKNTTVGFYSIYLLLSMIENYSLIGMPIPKKFKQVLEVIKEKAE